MAFYMRIQEIEMKGGTSEAVSPIVCMVLVDALRFIHPTFDIFMLRCARAGHGLSYKNLNNLRRRDSVLPRFPVRE